MSYFIAQSIAIKKDSITITGGDNNVFPRLKETINIPRTTEDERLFAQELVGGCIKPTPSCSDYFWWWAINELRKKYHWKSSKEEFEKAFAELLNLHKNRKNTRKAVVQVKAYGSDYYMRKGTQGRYYTYANTKEQATVFSQYQAEYLTTKYANTKVEFL